MSNHDVSEGRRLEPIRLRDGEDVDIPLWSGGLLFVEHEELIAFDFSPELAADIEEWGERSPTTAVRGALGTRRPWPTQAERDARGVDLVRRMKQELGDRYTFVYDPSRSPEEPPDADHPEQSDAMEVFLTPEGRIRPPGPSPEQDRP